MKELQSRLAANRTNSFSYPGPGGLVHRSFSDVHADVLKVMGMLHELGLGSRARVGVISSNCYEFVLLDLACLFGGYQFVPLPRETFKSDWTAIGNQLQLGVLFVESSLFQAQDKCVSLDRVRETLSGQALRVAPNSVPFADDEAFTIVFTSGSTGTPKALEVRLGCASEFITTCLSLFDLGKRDRIAVFLPLSQFSSRLYIYGAIWRGFDVLLSTPGRIFFDLKRCPPTVLQGIPHLFDSIYESMSSQVQASAAGRAAFCALQVANRVLPARIVRLAGRRLFHEAHAFWGGRMRLLITGAAPIRREVLEFFNTIGIPMFEAYGLVETGLITLNHPKDFRIGSVGKVLPGKRVEFDRDQQILVSSPYLWGREYCGAPRAASERVFVRPGWVATGDIGRLDADGFLYLMGRKDEVLVLSNGHKVHPALVEEHLSGSEHIKQAVVFGAGRPSLACVALPRSAQVSDDDLAREVRRVNQALSAHTQISAIVRAKAAFSIENGMITPNLKLNRTGIYEQHRHEIEDAYA
jgi:long-chain acyl-CoA synthetase